jgi:hypothetical protein
MKAGGGEAEVVFHSRWSGFDVSYLLTAGSQGELQIQSSTGINVLLAVRDSNIRKRAGRDGMRMLELDR